MKWIAVGVMLLLLILGVLLTRSGGRFISIEFAHFPEERLKPLMVLSVKEDEIELGGAIEVTTNARWYWLSKRLFPGIFWIEAKVNGRKVSLVLDTGTSITILDPQLAVNARITLISRKEKEEVHGITREKELTIPAYLGRLQKLEIDGLVARNLSVKVLGIQPTVKLLGIPIYQGYNLLGMNLLQHLAIHLDLQKGVVTLSRNPFPSKGPSAPLHVIKEPQEELGEVGMYPPLPFVEGFIGDSGPFPFLIDTGASGPVLIGEEVWQTLGLGEEEKTTLSRIQLGGIELKEVPAVRLSGMEFRKKIIILGNNIFLANGYKRLTLDFLAGKLYAEH